MWGICLPCESGPDVSLDSLLRGESKLKGLNFCTLITQARNGADVAVSLESIRVVSETYANSDYGFFLGNAIATKIDTPLMLDSYMSDMCIQSWGRLSYARALIKIRVDVELRDSIVVAMSKLTRDGFYTCIVSDEYEWKPSRVPIAKMSTANTSSKKKKGVEPTKEVSNSNPFDVFNSVVNDEELVDNDMATETIGFGTKSLLEQWMDSYVNGDYDEDQGTYVILSVFEFAKITLVDKIWILDSNESIEDVKLDSLQLSEGQNREHERLHNPGNPGHTQQNTKHGNGRGEPPHNILIHYYY
ncbi:hypothetical protein Tco_0284911 [Tanacetum coccineum]